MRATLYTVLFAASLAAQNSPGGWRRIGGGERPPDAAPPPAPAPAPAQAAAPAPGQIVLPAGAWITARVDQTISSDHAQAGDSFTATLVEPLVADGFVIARRGQTISGRVAEAQKAGRVKGTSRLALEITEISLVDGRQLPLRSQLMEYSGGTSVGRDAGAIGTTTGVGAAIGAAAGGGMGAGIGAAAGAVASTVGVLVTRGRETVVFPETPIKFRTLAAVAVTTDRAEHAFQPVRQEDYEPRQQLQRRATVAHPPYYATYPYPYFYGPRFFFYSGPRFYGRGYHRRW